MLCSRSAAVSYLWVWVCLTGPMLFARSAIGEQIQAEGDYRTREVSLAAGDFPPLPPDPNEENAPALPPLDEELWTHGGSYLYRPEGDRLNWPNDAHYELLRLPSDWQEPRPFTKFADFLGADPVVPGKLRDLGCYSLDPRFVAFGSCELFGQAFEMADQRNDLIGLNLQLDLDLRLTGTERLHVQFRPLGERNSGGSFYQFSNPEGYVSNATGEPDRYWFEGELHHFLGFEQDPFAQGYFNFMVGKFPFILHNSLLINDEIVGAVVSQNNIQLGSLSNLNIQCFVGANDVDTFPFTETRLYGVHGTADFKHDFFEATYAYVDADLGRSTHFVGLSRTRFYGPVTIAARGLAKLGDEAGTGNSHLAVLETNRHRVFECDPLGFHHAVFFCNAFWARRGWNSIAGTNFNRLRTAFEVDPLVRLTTAAAVQNTVGVTFGAQLFRHHDDESLIPEFAWESRGGESVFGVGIRHFKKTGPQTFLEILGITNWSDDPQFDRDGIAVSHTYLY